MAESPTPGGPMMRPIWPMMRRHQVHQQHQAVGEVWRGAASHQRAPAAAEEPSFPVSPPSLERHRGGGKGGESVIHPGLERSLLEARLVLLVDGIVCTSLPARVLLNRRPLCQHSYQPGAARCFACWRLRCSALLPRLVCSTLDAGLPPSHPSVHPIRSSRDIYYHPRRRPLGLVRSHASPPSTCPLLP